MLNWVRTAKRLHGTVQHSTARCHCVNNLQSWIKFPPPEIEETGESCALNFWMDSKASRYVADNHSTMGKQIGHFVLDEHVQNAGKNSM